MGVASEVADVKTELSAMQKCIDESRTWYSNIERAIREGDKDKTSAALRKIGEQLLKIDALIGDMKKKLN